MYGSNPTNYYYPYRRYKRKGLVLPGYNYLGPFNDLESGKPTNASDEAARIHDYEYNDLQKEGKNPYFTFNRADQKFLDSIKSNSDYGGVIGRTFFNAKKRLAKHDVDSSPLGVPDSPTVEKNRPKAHASKRRALDFSEPNTGHNLKSPIMSEGYKKPKYIKTKLSYRKNTGRWSPVQKHRLSELFQVGSNANFTGTYVYSVINSTMIQSQMFNPRYFQNFQQNAGPSGAAGWTLDSVNAISGANVAKGIFQWADTTSSQVEAGYDIHGVNPDTIADANTTAIVNPAYMAIAFHVYCQILCKPRIYIKNNSLLPAVVQVYEFIIKKDFKSDNPLSAITQVSVDIDAACNISYSERNWNSASTSSITPDTSAPGSPSNAPYFAFKDLLGSSQFGRRYKITNHAVVKLGGGEQTSINFGSFKVAFDLRTYIERLVKLGWSTAPGALGNPGIDTTELIPYIMKGTDRFYYFTSKGTLARAVDGISALGLNPTLVDVAITNDMSWRLKGSRDIQTPTKMTKYSGAATRMVIDDDATLI